MKIGHSSFIAGYITAIFLCAIGFLCILLRPYKDNLLNVLTTGLLVLISLMGLGIVGTHNAREGEMAEVIMATLLLVPHSVLWGYVGWRLIRKTAPYLMCCRGHTNADGRGYVSLLYSSPKEMNIGATN